MMVRNLKIRVRVGIEIFVDRRSFLENTEVIFNDPPSILKMPPQIRRREIDFLRHQKTKPSEKQNKNNNFPKFYTFHFQFLTSYVSPQLSPIFTSAMRGTDNL